VKPIDFEKLKPAPDQDNFYHTWRCNCGNELFEIRLEGIRCPVCGSPQYPYDDPQGAA